MKHLIPFFLVMQLLVGCMSKQTKSSTTEREIGLIVNQIEQNTKDKCYGGLTEFHIQRLLYLTSPGYQGKVDEKTKERINDLLLRIRESKREEKWEDEENREEEEREEEPPPEEE